MNRVIYLFFVLVVLNLVSIQHVTAGVIEDWQFDNGTELSNTTNAVPSGASFDSNQDGWTAVTNGYLSRISGATAGLPSYADTTDITNGYATFVAEGINIANWNYPSDRIILSFDNDTYLAAQLTFRYNDSTTNFEVYGSSPNGGTLDVVKTFRGDDITELSLGLEFNVSDHSYRLAWKRDAGKWYFSASTNTDVSHSAKRVRVQLEGYVSSGEVLKIDRLYVMDEQIVNTVTNIADWQFNDGTEISNTSDSAGTTSWDTNLVGWTGISNGKLVRDADKVNSYVWGEADTPGIYDDTATLILEGINIVNWSYESDIIMMKFCNGATEACRIDLVYNQNSGTIDLKGRAYYGSSLDIVKSFTGASISNLSIGLEFDIDNKEYRIAWKENGSKNWTYSAYTNTWSSGVFYHVADNVQLVFQGFNGSGESASIDRIYVMNEEIPPPPPPQGTVVLIK